MWSVSGAPLNLERTVSCTSYGRANTYSDIRTSAQVECEALGVHSIPRRAMSDRDAQSLDDIQRELAAVRQALVRARRNKKAQAKRRVEAGRRTGLYMGVLAVHALSEGTLEVAAHFWVAHRKQSGCRDEDVTKEQALAVTSKWIENASVDDFNEARNPVSAAGAKARLDALNFLSGAGAALWALRMVREQGHAPSSREIWQERTQLFRADQSEPGPPAMRAPTSNTLRSWARRWRRQWLFKKGKVKLRERFPVDELRTKARTFSMQSYLFSCFCWPQIWGQKAGHFLEPTHRKRESHDKSGGQKSVPFSAPANTKSRGVCGHRTPAARP